MAEQVAVLYALGHGYLDEVPVEKVGAFEESLLSYLHDQDKVALEKITEVKDLTAPVEEALTVALDAHAQLFKIENS